MPKVSKKSAAPKTAMEAMGAMGFMFEAEESAYEVLSSVEFSEKEIKTIIDCHISIFEGEYGLFGKLYVTMKKGKTTLCLKASADAEYAGVKLDPRTTRLLTKMKLAEGDVIDVDPEFIELKTLKKGREIFVRAKVYNGGFK